jgi:aspartate carbamoyltransferase regulatory subunit
LSVNRKTVIKIRKIIIGDKNKNKLSLNSFIKTNFHTINIIKQIKSNDKLKLSSLKNMYGKTLKISG